MSQPVPGNYYIVNSVVATGGARLAITFNGQSQALTVEPLVPNIRNLNQTWTIANYNNNQQTVSSGNVTSLQVAFGDNYLTALPANAYTWIITGDGLGNFTFQDGQQSVYWDLTVAEADQQVTYESTPGYGTQKWWLYNAS